MVLKWAQNGPEMLKNLNHSLRSERFFHGFYLHSDVLEVLVVMCFHSIDLECVIVHMQ